MSIHKFIESSVQILKPVELEEILSDLRSWVKSALQNSSFSKVLAL